jgi:hypothetical protein
MLIRNATGFKEFFNIDLPIVEIVVRLTSFE